jgi:hypothetical protein
MICRRDESILCPYVFSWTAFVKKTLWLIGTERIVADWEDTLPVTGDNTFAPTGAELNGAAKFLLTGLSFIDRN